MTERIIYSGTPPSKKQQEEWQKMFRYNCAELYVEFMKECTYYPHDDIEDTAEMFRVWLKKKNEVKNVN
jgi:hypothetical protein